MYREVYDVLKSNGGNVEQTVMYFAFDYEKQNIETREITNRYDESD